MHTSPDPATLSWLAPHPDPSRLKAARRGLDAHGDVDPVLLGDELARSWQRSLRAGLLPHGLRSGGPHASAAQLLRARQNAQALLDHAGPVLDLVVPAVRATDGLLLLADADGTLLHATGDDRFADRAQRVALRPGARWSEELRGTNAIGTALADRRPVAVHGAEHFLARNGFLSCCAAPVFGPDGAVRGVVDVSGDQRVWATRSLSHALGLATLAARLLSLRLFDDLPAEAWRVQVHPARQGLGSPGQGLLVLRDDGRLLGVDAQARRWLASVAGVAQGRDGSSAPELHRLLAAAPVDTPGPLTLPDGSVLWVRVQRPPGAPAPSPAPLPVPSPVPSPASAAAAARVSPPPAADAPASLAAPARPRPAPSHPLDLLDSPDPRVKAVVDRARRVSGRGVGLVIQGESGVGKEVLARALHASGPRASGRFVVVQASSLPATLLETELFGHEGGAFTGAREQGRPGRVLQADGGTLFLDDVAELPPAAQAALLRVLQDRAVQPLGGQLALPVDFDLVCATRETLVDAVRAGRLREDLYYRLNGLTVTLPPLRDRHDRAALVRTLLAEAAAGRPLTLAPELEAALAAHHWPGNLRQLAQALRTACALLDDGEHEIGWPQLPDDLAEALRSTG